MYLCDNKAYLTEVEVERFVFEMDKVESDKDSLDAVLNRLKSLDWMGQEYSKLLVPALPCLDLKMNSEGVPGLGYIKSESGMEILRSGRRSGIMKDGDIYLRLKGCGNLHHGFNKEPTAYPEDCFEIRGCCFAHTVLREQYMSWIVNEKLKDFGFCSGNLPREYWKYKNTELEQVSKYCGVFVTLGEQRLGSHLIGGIDKILTQLSEGVSEELVRSLLPQERKGEIFTVKLVQQTGPLNESIHSWTAQGVYKDSSKFVDVLKTDPNFSLFPEFCNGKKQVFSDICFISYRIGWEVGKIKRILQDNNVCWGYFIDHNPFEPHCNAHCNNFIVLGPGCKNLLAPVDFDMAFMKDEFVSTVEGEGFGKCDEELFENWMNCERINLELTLAGQENMANFKYSDHIGNALSVFTKDLMVIGYREGFDNTQPRYDWNRESIETTLRQIMETTQGLADY